MIKKDIHIHSTFCDGKNTAEEMVLSAIEKGLDTVGICCHSYTFFDTSYCIKEEQVKNFQAEINRLKSVYAHKIKVLCGVEQDYYSTAPTDGFDYVIGSVHYFKVGDKYFSVDHFKEDFIQTVQTIFDGNYFSAVKNYFDAVSCLATNFDLDVIGHFDLICKFNENDCLFDTTVPEYVEAWQTAVDKLIPLGKPFEINTGGLIRGNRKSTYPNLQIIEYIKAKGGKFILSSDSHKKENIAFAFEQFKDFIL